MIKTVSDPLLQSHVKAIEQSYSLFKQHLSDDDIAATMADEQDAVQLQAKFPEAWAYAAKLHGLNPDGTPIAPGSFVP